MTIRTHYQNIRVNTTTMKLTCSRTKTTRCDVTRRGGIKLLAAQSVQDPPSCPAGDDLDADSPCRSAAADVDADSATCSRRTPSESSTPSRPAADDLDADSTTSLPALQQLTLMPTLRPAVSACSRRTPRESSTPSCPAADDDDLDTDQLPGDAPLRLYSSMHARPATPSTTPGACSSLLHEHNIRLIKGS
jgi:hypothetical protein